MPPYRRDWQEVPRKVRSLPLTISLIRGGKDAQDNESGAQRQKIRKAGSIRRHILQKCPNSLPPSPARSFPVPVDDLRFQYGKERLPGNLPRVLLRNGREYCGRRLSLPALVLKTIRNLPDKDDLHNHAADDQSNQSPVKHYQSPRRFPKM